MTPHVKKAVHIAIMLLGLLLIIGGIDTGKTGAVVIGIIVIGVNAKAMMEPKRET